MIASLRGPDFPISAHGRGNAYISFCLLVYKQKNKQTNSQKKAAVLFSTVGYFMESDSPEWHSAFYYRDEIEENVNTENIDNFKSANKFQTGLTPNGV